MVTSLLLALALASGPKSDGGMLALKGKRVMAEVARTEQERSKALTYRAMFPGERCMMLILEEEKPYPVQTRRFLLAFDIAWLDAEGRVVAFKDQAPPCKTGQDCPTYGGEKPARYVVFFQSGTLKRWGVKLGDKATWDLHFTDGVVLRNGPDMSEAHPTESKASGRRKKRKG